MNRFDKFFGLKGEARLRYSDGDYKIVTAGDFVRCAVTGDPILLTDLRYWNVELQEAYASAAIAMQRVKDLKARGQSRG